MDSTTINAKQTTHGSLVKLSEALSQQILGQEDLIKKILITLLCDGHLLVEGAPGLAKTKAIKSLANHIEGSFHRIQFTPDLLPSDLTGTDIYRPQDLSFIFEQGPLFHNIILADEINRAPAKVQSALLEAMAERQVTIGKKTYPLPELFLVMATQNPIEQEGTYPLPEAQLDRFMMYVNVDYPKASTELEILRLAEKEALFPLKAQSMPFRIKQDVIFNARKEVLSVHLSEGLEQYIVSLVMATRNAKAYSQNLSDYIEFGASPRATIALSRCAKANAYLASRDYVTPEDIHAVVFDVLRHRLILTYEAQAKGVLINDMISELISLVAIP